MINHDSPRLILFDIDGTLLLTGGAGRVATRRAMEEVFGTSSRLDKHKFSGKTDWHTLVELLEEFGYDESRIGEVMERYQVAAAKHTAEVVGDFPVKACPGALDLVRALHKRDDVLLGVVTGNVAMAAPIKLRAAGFDPDWFPVGAFGSEKRDRDQLPPLALMRAMRHYHRHIDPEEVIIVGDTPMDVSCARALGAVAVAVSTGFSTREELEAAQPDFLLDDLTQFLDVVFGEQSAKLHRE